jgi:hypothetical protein
MFVTLLVGAETANQDVADGEGEKEEICVDDVELSEHLVVEMLETVASYASSDAPVVLHTTPPPSPGYGQMVTPKAPWLQHQVMFSLDVSFVRQRDHSGDGHCIPGRQCRCERHFLVLSSSSLWVRVE